MKTKVLVILVLCVMCFINCQKSEDLNAVKQDCKIKVAVENIGEIHNELLKSYQSKNQTRGAVILPENISTYFDAFKEELFKSNKYDISSSEMIKCETELYNYQDVLSLKIDSNFYDNSLNLLLERIKKSNKIDNEVKKIIYQITDKRSTFSADELSLLAKRYQSYKGGEYLLVYSNIFGHSSEYWHPVATRGSAGRKVIVADCIGGLLGLSCCGAMSIIWGAAFSYSMDKCLEPYRVIPKPEPTHNTSEELFIDSDTLLPLNNNKDGKLVP